MGRLGGEGQCAQRAGEGDCEPAPPAVGDAVNHVRNPFLSKRPTGGRTDSIGTPPGALDAPFVQPRPPAGAGPQCARGAADHGRMRRIAQLCERLRSLTITPDAEGAFDDARRRVVERTPLAERRVDLAMAAAFLVVATGLALAAPPEPVAAGTAVALVLALALLSRVEIDLALGFAVPTELAVVPMLFLLPPGVVPLLVGVALVLTRIVDALTGPRHVERIARGFCDAWFSLAPATVFVLGSVDGVHAADWPWWLAAFAAQLGLDMLVSSFGEWLRAGRWPRLHLRELGVVAFVDGALAPIGLLVAVVAADAPVALLAVLPLGALHRRAGPRERRHRLEQAVRAGRRHQGPSRCPRRGHRGRRLTTRASTAGASSQLSSSRSPREPASASASQRLVEFGALLHDVGKVRVPNEIINKAGPLDDDEWAIMLPPHHRRRGECLPRVGGMMQGGRADRPRLARGLGRHRLSRRSRGRGDPARVRGSCPAADAYSGR